MTTIRLILGNVLAMKNSASVHCPPSSNMRVWNGCVVSFDVNAVCTRPEPALFKVQNTTSALLNMRLMNFIWAANGFFGILGH